MSKRTIWHLEVPPHLNEQLEDYITKGTFKTKSEFIRTAVRDRLKEEKKKLDVEKEQKHEKRRA
ncbi:MAG: ribbon-helix-helix domain-containing protein [Nitrosopumilus sp.]|nr:ribbon-helix-helix domain-containing protein [Nitrosopumilus sp.]